MIFFKIKNCRQTDLLLICLQSVHIKMCNFPNHHLVFKIPKRGRKAVTKYFILGVFHYVAPLKISKGEFGSGHIDKLLNLLTLRFSETGILCVLFGTKHFFWFSYFVILARRNVIYFIAFRVYIPFNLRVTARSSRLFH